MVGKIYYSVFPFYDTNAHRNSFKKRPVLIIGDTRNNDYTVLPISSVSRRENLDSEYDIEVNPALYPLLGLSKVSYIRTHKQTTVHRSSISDSLGDVRGHYEDLYLLVLEKLEKFNAQLLGNAI